MARAPIRADNRSHALPRTSAFADASAVIANSLAEHSADICATSLLIEVSYHAIPEGQPRESSLLQARTYIACLRPALTTLAGLRQSPWPLQLCGQETTQWLMHDTKRRGAALRRIWHLLTVSLRLLATGNKKGHRVFRDTERNSFYDWAGQSGQKRGFYSSRSSCQELGCTRKSEKSRICSYVMGYRVRSPLCWYRLHRI